jgi:hypothetical protein
MAGDFSAQAERRRKELAQKAGKIFTRLFGVIVGVTAQMPSISVIPEESFFAMTSFRKE